MIDDAEQYSPGTLTEAEHQAMQLTAQLANALAHIVGDDLTRLNDLREVLGHVHAVQHAVLSQAAARAYPHRYRLLGGAPIPVLFTENREDSPAVAGPR